MSTAGPMDGVARKIGYRLQTGRDELTGPQRRRAKQKGLRRLGKYQRDAYRERVRLALRELIARARRG